MISNFKPHRGIRIDKIPAFGIGGLIFTIGTLVVFGIGIPAIGQFFLYALPLGGLLGLALHCWRTQTRW